MLTSTSPSIYPNCEARLRRFSPLTRPHCKSEILCWQLHSSRTCQKSCQDPKGRKTFSHSRRLHAHAKWATIRAQPRFFPLSQTCLKNNHQPADLRKSLQVRVLRGKE